jgi:hypothetical protein
VSPEFLLPGDPNQHPAGYNADHRNEYADMKYKQNAPILPPIAQILFIRDDLTKVPKVAKMAYELPMVALGSVDRFYPEPKAVCCEHERTAHCEYYVDSQFIHIAPVATPQAFYNRIKCLSTPSV